METTATVKLRVLYGAPDWKFSLTEYILLPKLPNIDTKNETKNVNFYS